MVGTTGANCLRCVQVHNAKQKHDPCHLAFGSTAPVGKDRGPLDRHLALRFGSNPADGLFVAKNSQFVAPDCRENASPKPPTNTFG